MAFAKAASLFVIFGMAFAFSACSNDEKSEPLPELAPIDLPKDVAGLYSGSLPCDDCTARMVRMTLKADSTAEVVQTIVKDSMTVDSLKGTYAVSDSILKVTLAVDDANMHWSYKRSASGNLTFLNSAGSVYEDENGKRWELIRIFKAPAKEAKP